MADKNFIDDLMLISQQEADELFSKMKEVPAADALVRLFLRAANNQSMMKTKSGNVYAPPNVDCVMGSVGIQRRHDHVLTDFFPVNLDRLEPEDERYGYYSMARIVAGPMNTGTWCYGRGEHAAHGLRMEMKNEFQLPSKQVRWTLEHLTWFSRITSEYLHLNEQKGFWRGDKERQQS